MPHAFAGAFQKACPVVERRPVEEADIHMSAEGVDVAKRRISHTRSGVAIVQKFANVRSAAAHLFKPRPGDLSQLVVRLGKPGVNAGVSLNRAREPQEFTHETRLPVRLVMSRRRSGIALSPQMALHREARSSEQSGNHLDLNRPDVAQ